MAHRQPLKTVAALRPTAPAPAAALHLRVPTAAGSVWRTSLLASCAVAAMGMVVPTAWAQPAAPAAADAQRSFSIPAGPLDQAIQAFARAAGVAVSADAALLQGKRSPGLAGSFSVSQGWAELLRGQGLQALPQADGSYTLRATGTATSAAVAPPKAEAKTEAVLAAVTVTANQLGEVTEGSGSYAPGSIATATRLVLSARETPQSISVITRQEMDDFNLTSIDQVIEHTPGISIVTYDSERTEYYARGFAIQNFQYDGIPMTRDSSYSAGNTLSDTVMYDRVEVLKGATGLLTGSGTPGATINLIRKKPTRSWQGHASLSAGRWDTVRGELDVGGPVNDSGSVRVRAVASHQDKQSQLDRYQRSTSLFYGILEADLTPSTLLTVGMDAQNNRPTASTWGGIPLLDANGNFNNMPRAFNNGANWSRWDQYTRTGFATLEHTLDSGWVAKLQLNHQVNGYDANLGAAASGNPDPANGTGTAMWVGQYIGRTTANAADLYVSGPFSLAGREHELVLGGSLAKRRWKNDGYWSLPGYNFDVADYYQWQGNVPAPAWGSSPDYSNDETTREKGAYATARWNLRDDLKLITGGRWSSYKNTVQGLDESGVFIPYLGVVYDINRTWSAYASYSSIFSPQSAQDEQGRTLDPVQGKNHEIGLKAAFLDGRLNTSVALFQLKQDNFAIESGGTTPTGNPAYRAAQGVKTEGFEIEASGQLTPAWQLQAGYSHSSSRQQGQRVSTLTPARQFNLYTSYTLDGALSGLKLGGGVRWQDKTWGEIPLPTGGTTVHTAKGYWLLDLMARYQFNKQWSGSVNINNVLDKQYYTIFSWYSTYTWGAPRNVTVSMNYTF